MLAEVRAAIRGLVRDCHRREPVKDLLDVGCWDGAETRALADAVGARAHGVEIFPAPAAAAEARGIEVARADLERDPLPWADGAMDLVIVNQVFEHLKNVWLPMSEIHRVTRPGGALILSVPNLGSLHNRALLALGRQPTSIRTFGPHVRGYVAGEIARFVAFEGAYRVTQQVGVGFYPVPARWAAPLARIWPGASHTTIVVAIKPAGAPETPWRRHLERETSGGVQTFYDAAAAPEPTRARQAP